MYIYLLCFLINLSINECNIPDIVINPPNTAQTLTTTLNAFGLSCVYLTNIGDISYLKYIVGINNPLCDLLLLYVY